MSKVIEIKDEMKNAMKAKDKDKVTALRLLVSALENEKIEQKVSVVEQLSDEDVVKITLRLVKKLDQERESLVAVGRSTDLVDRQKEIFEVYLPKQLSDDEVIEIVREKIKILGVTEMNQQGKVIGALSKELNGQVPMSKVSEIVREELSK